MKTDYRNLRKIASDIRIKTLELLYEAGSGHLGSCMSVIETLVSLYFSGLFKYNSQKPESEDRDYFLLSNGHACPAFYVLLAKASYFPESKLDNSLFKLNTGLEGHPVRGSLPGIEISSGSLGMGLSVGEGIALGLKLKKKENKVVVMMSDGEQQEGSTWEAVMAASHYKLNNLIAIIDRNGIQIGGRIKDNMKIEPLAKKYQSFGWKVIKVNGHNFNKLILSLKKAFKAKKPTLIIAKTIPAKGVYKLEGRKDTHHPHLSEDIYKKSIKRLKND
ncbi:transketolase [Candidatus Beckwithbacteria bacterium CG10_big_fil_rev_8_21_14_0_10_34_10]|uniref:Transketolase n=1 Tax=Candidatus Beckwithbacteria bacterium CG10_big_fil_rev_8_21_14_0_10_34_10 TaxID=1974495 RepID=A0A2H0W8E0_9BACT|nr:MAG: transketolase [Candidatus Beckwithbacteria bacterium CG10_big_fil_rev_8_21_14_0_10_34_10]